jgi:anhydro-N-acetylmuramic acid kinase
MSGTSLDGLDVAYCRFERKQTWDFSILQGKTFPYSSEWKSSLSAAHTLSGGSLMELHAAYGRYVGDICKQFISRQKIRKVDFIASHGHTVFHQPEKGFTFQLGEGSSIHAASGIPVICDFRTLDVALGGEGAPLVPIGDKILFSKYNVCLNLGGIANLSMEAKSVRRAFDICFCNMSMNYLSELAGLNFDEGGRMAASGKIHLPTLDALEKIYEPLRKSRPSIGRERFEQQVRTILDNPQVMVKDRLRTVAESVAQEIVRAMPSMRKGSSMLVTGGGAFNTFLVSLIREKLSGRAEVVVPDRQTIDFKEALVFAFLGVLRMRGEVNALKSVTHARRDSSGGGLIGLP